MEPESSSQRSPVWNKGPDERKRLPVTTGGRGAPLANRAKSVTARAEAHVCPRPRSLVRTVN